MAALSSHFSPLTLRRKPSSRLAHRFARAAAATEDAFSFHGTQRPARLRLADHYDVSIKVAEHDLLADVRKAAKDTVLIAGGFSCREQIRQTTDRRGLHIAQVLQMALGEGERGAAGAYPERQYMTAQPARPSVISSIAVLAASAVIGAAIWQVLRRRN